MDDNWALLPTKFVHKVVPSGLFAVLSLRALVMLRVFTRTRAACQLAAWRQRDGGPPRRVKLLCVTVIGCQQLYIC